MNKNILITGGTKGIGKNISSSLLENNFNVICLSRYAAKDINNKNFFHYECDVSKSDEVFKTIQKIKEKFSSISGIVNNAGFSEWRPITKIDDKFLEKIFSTNLFSAFFVIRSCIDLMPEDSSVINISSIAGKRGSINNSGYCSTKFAMNGMTQSLSKELGHKKIRVNAICPVLIETPGLLKALDNGYSPAKLFDSTIDFLDNFKKANSALPYLPDGSDVAEMVLYLLSEKAKSVTGQCINLDCGVFPQ